MEIRAFTIKFSKKKAKRKRDEELALMSEMMKLQTKLQTTYSDSDKIELDKLKTKLSKIASVKTRGAIVRSRARWYASMARETASILQLRKN